MKRVVPTMIIPLVLMLGLGRALADTRCDQMERQDAQANCIGEELASADKALNVAYAELRRILPVQRRELLKRAETSWVSARAMDCEFEASVATGGTGYQSVYLSCQIEATKGRTTLLQNWRRSS
jgi:uncharacterized protein YecT (DUF1311 family)